MKKPDRPAFNAEFAVPPPTPGGRGFAPFPPSPDYPPYERATEEVHIVGPVLRKVTHA